nr:zinc finger, CCHC-type [Tanacetum cinerariifolium]
MAVPVAVASSSIRDELRADCIACASSSKILITSIDDEIGSIMENNSWVLSDLPPGCKPLGYKWIFKRKMKVDGTVDRFKARLVIQGFRQKERIDYFDTYAPVARITTIRFLLALAAIHNLVIHQMDVKTAFLNGDLDKEVYMKQPEGFIMPGNEHKVCKLVKSLYGQKQAPKQWHQKFDEVVLSSGFHLNQSDKCVYNKFDDSGKGVIICLYVDDMLIFCTDQIQVDKTKKFMSSRFSIKDMVKASVILGVKIKRENKEIVITQSHYIEKILKKFNREDCSPMSTPMDPVEKLKPNTGKPVDQLEYSRAIRCLMYAMTSTRPDIAYVVGRLGRFTGYSDVNWINHVKDSSSTSGWVFLLRGGAILWASKKQTCITGSTVESEFVALAAAVLNRALKEMVNSMLSYSGLSEGFWREAMLTAYYLLNRIPNKRNKTTPYELWYKKRPNLAFLRVWGCRAVVRLPDPKRKTLGEKESRDAIFDKYRFSSIPRPKDIIPNSDESQRDDLSDDVPNENPEPRKGKRVRKAKLYGFDFQLYLVVGSRDQVGLQYSYCYSIEEDPRTYNEA